MNKSMAVPTAKPYTVIDEGRVQLGQSNGRVALGGYITKPKRLLLR